MNKKINEVLSWPEQEVKMAAWHNGTRGANVKSMNFDKLNMNAQICKQKGYIAELNQLEAEARNRGLHLATMGPVQPQAQQSSPVPKQHDLVFTEMDFHQADAQFVKDNAFDAKAIIDNALVSNSTIKNLCISLVYTVILGLDKSIKNRLKEFLTINCGISIDKLKTYLKEILNDQEICNRLNSIAENLNEQLHESAGLEATTPYMLRNDGELFTCGSVHPYIKQWNTADFKTNINQLRNNRDVIDWFIEHSNDEKTIELLKQLKVDLDREDEEIKELFEEVSNRTNQEFCKVRTSNFKYKYGGDNGEIYFRIDSTNFNWFDLIWKIVSQFKDQIKYVTIMKDNVVRGKKLEFLGFGKYIFNKMPVDEFLTLPGNPIIEELTEDIEKHDELNPKLWEDNKLKQEVKEKIELIVNEFLDGLKEDEISIAVKDVVLIGSNCSYNYTKDSDLDIHIIAEHIDAPENLYYKIYSAYRSLFNKKIEVEFYGIPVELYVEVEGMPTVSNGCYSVMNDEWIKEPVKEDIPEIDKDAFDKEFKVWEDRYNKIVDNSEEKLEEALHENTLNEVLRSINKMEIIVSILNYVTGNDYSYLLEKERSIGGTRLVPKYILHHADHNHENNVLDNLYILNRNDHQKYHHGVISWDEIEKINISNILNEFLKDKSSDIVESIKTNILAEDVNTAKSIIADQIRGEWEAISNYDKAVSELENLDGDFQNAIDILNDIADEEEVHVGEEQKVLSELDNNVLNNIKEGEEETEEKISEPAKDLDFDESLNEEIHTKQLDEIESFINDIYALRQKGLQESGEYGIENLVFKEIRNKGYLDNLKDLKNQLVSKELSLEALEEDTVKNSKGKWVNKGEDGTHGEFKTKKAADAQRKAMFANGYHESLNEQIEHVFDIIVHDYDGNYFELDNIDELLRFKNNEIDVYFVDIYDEAGTKNSFDTIDEAVQFIKDYNEYVDEYSNLEERLDERKCRDYYNEISRIAYAHPIIQDNGLFNIYNIKENDVDRIVRRIRDLDYIEWVQKNESGKYDFSKVVMFGQPQPRYYNITGKIKN